MTPWLLLAAALIAPVIGRRVSGDLCPPPVIVASVWCATLGLFALHLLPYAPLREPTTQLLAGAVALLVAGSAAGAVWMARRPAASPAAGAVPAARVVPSAWWLALYSAIALGGIAWFVTDVVRVLGPGGFANAEVLRNALSTYRIPSTFLFAQLFCIATPIVTLALVLEGARIPRLLVVFGFAGAAGTVISTDRTQSFLLVGTAAFMIAYRVGPTVTVGRAVAGFAAAGVFIVASFLAIELWVRKSPERMGLFLQVPGMTWVPGEGAKGPGTDGLGPVAGRAVQRLAGVYVYATGSFAALDLLLADPPPRTNGMHTFFPIVRPLERAGWIDRPVPSPIPDYVLLYPQPAPGLAPLSFNAYTFLYYPLLDFGVAGALAYALAVGAGCGVVYGWMRRDRRDPLRLLAAGQTATALTLTVLVNKFNNTAWWYVLLLTLLPWLAEAGLRPRRGGHGRTGERHPTGCAGPWCRLETKVGMQSLRMRWICSASPRAAACRSSSMARSSAAPSSCSCTSTTRKTSVPPAGSTRLAGSHSCSWSFSPGRRPV